jgi:hypothetical protein
MLGGGCEEADCCGYEVGPGLRIGETGKFSGVIEDNEGEVC